MHSLNSMAGIRKYRIHDEIPVILNTEIADVTQNSNEEARPQLEMASPLPVSMKFRTALVRFFKRLT
ncbi:hypothetical protein [Pseudomonas fluorescens]|uniref:hypothetical protein n=1 Tax=Pseudomonas fluorescens TaxID=294 RepID=UPI0010F19192|nr:hypothetical protein [Pseudomonas fluorescens]TCV66225.1 hypothetical protein EDB98_107233 [Pseudomonas fluorescens]